MDIRNRRIVCCVSNDLNHDQRMQRICNSMQAAGANVLLVGRKKQSSAALSSQVFEQWRLNCFFEKGKFFYLEFQIRLFFYLLFHSADVIYSVDLDTIAPCAIVSKLKGVKSIYDSHEYFTEVPELNRRNWEKKVWTLIEKIFIRCFDAHITVSKSIAHIYNEKYTLPFQTIRNLPWQSKMHVSRNEGSYLLYQGALNEGRGLEALILAMKRLHYKLKLAGEGDISQHLKDLVRENDLIDQVEFLGNVLPKDLQEVTAHAFIGFNLIEARSLSYYYSLSNKFFDYIQLGVPSVNMKFPEYEAVLSEFPCAVMIENLNEDEIMNAIQLIEKNYEIMHQNCLIASPFFTWENEEKSLLRLLNDL